MTVGLFSGDIQPNEILAGSIHVYYDVWPNYDETISMLEEVTKDPESGIRWSRAVTLGNNNSQKRTNLDLGVTRSALETGNYILKEIHNQMFLLLVSTAVPYSNKFDTGSLWHEYYNALKYSGGTEYKAHADGDTATQRSVSAIIYLNDNYEGGELEFVHFGIKVKPKAGSLFLFPSNYAYTHIAHPVTSGTKYALVTWLQDQPLRN